MDRKEIAAAVEPTPPDVTHLVLGAQTGDHEAFTGLVRRFQDMAVGYAYSVIGDFQLAEDAAQDAFVGAWRDLPRLRDPASFPGWFRRLVFTRCTRVTRRLRADRAPFASAAEPASGAVGVDDGLIQRDRRQVVFRALQSLPQEERLATTLFYIADYSHRDIAAFLELSPATVNNRLRSARRRLQEEILIMAKNQLHDRAPSRDGDFAQRVARLTRPHAMDTDRYLGGLEAVDGRDAWALFCAAAAGDLARVQALIERDPRLVNAQYWYQFPIHMAVREGHADVVQLLLEGGADPGLSNFMYNSWDSLLGVARLRRHGAVEKLLVRAMAERFGYHPDFEPLRDALRDLDRERVGRLLAGQPHLARAADTFGSGCIHWAVLTGQLDLVDRLLELGAGIDARRADGQTPLLLSVHGDYWYSKWVRARDRVPPPGDRWEATRYLLARGAEYTLSVACVLGDIERVRQILRESPQDARRLDSCHANPLTYAAVEGHTPIVRLLLDSGADPNLPEARSPRGRALFAAAAGNHLETARVLLEAGADPNAGEDSSGVCLTIVVHNHPTGHQAMQQLLREHGAVTPAYAMTVDQLKETLRTGARDVLYQDQFAHELLGRGDAELFELFIEHHADAVPHLVPTDIWGGNLPDAALVQRLLDCGLDPNRANWIGRTFLHVAAEKGAVAVAQVLLEAGADLEAVELDGGSTPLGCAVGKGQTEMVRFLLERGADPDAPAGSPWATARVLAAGSERADLVALLDRAGR